MDKNTADKIITEFKLNAEFRRRAREHSRLGRKFMSKIDKRIMKEAGFDSEGPIWTAMCQGGNIALNDEIEKKLQADDLQRLYKRYGVTV